MFVRLSFCLYLDPSQLLTGSDHPFQIPLVSKQTLRKVTSGNVIDLISTDVERIELAPRWIFLSTFTILEIAAVISLLFYLISWEAIMGVFYLVAVIPFVMIISSLCAQLLQETATVSDHRISMMIELISGIRALKANALENIHKDRIQEVRR